MRRFNARPNRRWPPTAGRFVAVLVSATLLVGLPQATAADGSWGSPQLHSGLEPRHAGEVAAPPTDGDVAAPTYAEVADQPSPSAARTVSQAPELYDPSVIRDVRITFQDVDNWDQLPGCSRGRPGAPGTVDSDVDYPATLEVGNTVLENVGVRCKGNSSLGISNNKKPLNVTTDAFVDGQTLWGYDVFNLNNNWNDPSQLREALSLRAMGLFMPAPRTTFARVTVQGEYLGLYTIVEQVEQEFVAHWYPEEDDGVMVKGDSPIRISFDSSPLIWEGEDLEPYREGYEVKGRHADSDEAYILLREAIRALDAPVSDGGLSESEFPDHIHDYIDVDAALWYIVGNNVLANFDSYYVGKNFFFYRGDASTQFRMIPWDLGLSFGTFGLGVPGGAPGAGDTAEASPFEQIDARNRPLIRRLLAVPEFRADYLAHYRDFLTTIFTPEWIEAQGGAYQALIAAAVRDEASVKGNVAGAFTYAQFETNLTEAVMAGGGRRGPREFPGLRDFTDARSAYLLGLDQLRPVDVELDTLTWTPAAPTTADAVTIQAQFAGSAQVVSAEVRYRVNGGPEQRIAMSVDGGKWSAPIPRQRAGADVTLVLRLGTQDGRAVFYPAANQIEPYTYEVAGVELTHAPAGDLVINEFLAANETGLTDPSGEHDDWIELYNRGAAPVSLAGRFLSDDPTDPWAFALPDVVLAPGDHLIVWADGDAEEGELHAPFRLNKAGETVVLASSEAILDLVEFGPQAADVSYGRWTSGAQDWGTCPQPSPGAPNACGPNAPTPVTPPGRVYLPLTLR